MKRLFKIMHVDGYKHVKKMGITNDFSDKSEAKKVRDEANKRYLGFYITKSIDHVHYEE